MQMIYSHRHSLPSKPRDQRGSLLRNRARAWHITGACRNSTPLASSLRQARHVWPAQTTLSDHDAHPPIHPVAVPSGRYASWPPYRHLPAHVIQYAYLSVEHHRSYSESAHSP